MYEMKQEYLTGIELIDEEHKKIFEIAESAYQLLHNELLPDKYDHISLILNELRDYTKKHFADEEAYMESINYKRMFTQKIQHQKFIEKLEEFDMDSIDENQDAAILDILNFLADWLIEHILENDKRIGEE
ncbi:bacteriohemerythrin [Anaeromicropila populeti]|uniref:Hemerythrin n=1 Tax=Anaeromicropila populeti TaxID=37658 RepID=A0A1I6IA62_9FIRM|nr:hemerythrin family protein [Anaeromicropila populeti]SFR63524.1 hemerythrin [Anaeromicropila populeti]